MNSNVSAWTFGGSILSFAFPMLLFIVVAGALYVLYTKPEFVPGTVPRGWSGRCPTRRCPGSPGAARGTGQPPRHRPRPPAEPAQASAAESGADDCGRGG